MGIGMGRKAKLLLLAAQNYEKMFARLLADPAFAASLVKETGGHRPCTVEAVRDHGIRNEIAWAKRVLKTSDRIVWWLKWYRLGILKLYLPEEYTKEKARLGGGDVDWVDFENLHPWIRLHSGAEHYFGTACPGIQNWHPKPNQTIVDALYHEITDIETEWQESRKGILKPRPEDTALITFADGWAWWLLPRNKCDEESKAMGHCGNGGSYDETQRILSLREPKPKGEWYPHCTFILESNGFLGEMKGRNNQKPVARYHKYIVELLKNDIVKGIQGGGYKPENNFSIDDLPEDQREQLYQVKPQLMTIADYYRKFGSDETFRAKVISHFKGNGEKVEWDADRKLFITERWADLKALVEDRGNDTARWVISVLTGDDFVDWDSGMSLAEEAESILRELSQTEKDRIYKTILAKYPEETQEWAEAEGYENAEEADPSDSDLATLADQVGEVEMLGAMSRAYSDGLQSGAEEQMYDALKSAMADGSSAYISSKPEGGWWDDEWLEGMDANAILGLIKDDETLDDYHRYNDGDRIDVHAPSYGFSDYDGDRAVESFREGEYNVDKEYLAACGEPAKLAIEEQNKQSAPLKGEFLRVRDQVRKAIEAKGSKRGGKRWDRACSDSKVGDWKDLIRWAREVVPDAFETLGTVNQPPAPVRAPSLLDPVEVGK